MGLSRNKAVLIYQDKIDYYQMNGASGAAVIELVFRKSLSTSI